jgi:inositol oxygenase
MDGTPADVTDAAASKEIVVVGGVEVTVGPILAKDVDTNGKTVTAFRNYVDSARQQTVENFYRINHKLQTYEFVQAMSAKYASGGLCKMGMWECLEYMDGFVDDSDPDTEFSQMQHALQTAEAIREKYPDEAYDWFCLVGLIHDLGKIIGHRPTNSQPQWCVVGDTFPVGCAFEKTSNVFPEFFAANPDTNNAKYNTPNGVYSAHCGLNNLTMSYGHDEYLYQTCLRNGAKLPEPALYIIRFHSFYPWHSQGGYMHLANEKDAENLRWVKEFQKFDLYSKAHRTMDANALKRVYMPIIAKYFPDTIDW